MGEKESMHVAERMSREKVGVGGKDLMVIHCCAIHTTRELYAGKKQHKAPHNLERGLGHDTCIYIDRASTTQHRAEQHSPRAALTSPPLRGISFPEASGEEIPRSTTNSRTPGLQHARSQYSPCSDPRALWCWPRPRLCSTG